MLFYFALWYSFLLFERPEGVGKANWKCVWLDAQPAFEHSNPCSNRSLKYIRVRCWLSSITQATKRYSFNSFGVFSLFCSFAIHSVDSQTLYTWYLYCRLHLRLSCRHGSPSVVAFEGLDTLAQHFCFNTDTEATSETVGIQWLNTPVYIHPGFCLSIDDSSMKFSVCGPASPLRFSLHSMGPYRADGLIYQV